jgi:hypothetical protein
MANIIKIDAGVLKAALSVMLEQQKQEQQDAELAMAIAAGKPVSRHDVLEQSRQVENDAEIARGLLLFEHIKKLEKQRQIAADAAYARQLA